MSTTAHKRSWLQTALFQKMSVQGRRSVPLMSTNPPLVFKWMNQSSDQVHRCYSYHFVSREPFCFSKQCISCSCLMLVVECYYPCWQHNYINFAVSSSCLRALGGHFLCWQQSPGQHSSLISTNQTLKVSWQKHSHVCWSRLLFVLSLFERFTASLLDKTIERRGKKKDISDVCILCEGCPA